MKKIVLFIVASLLCSCLSPFGFAQSESAEEILSKKIGTDGLMLAMKQSDAIFEIGKMGNFSLESTYKFPEGGEALYYSNQNLSYVICDNNQDLVWRIDKTFFGSQWSTQQTFKSRKADLLYRYGSPVINEISHIIWRGKFYKVQLQIQPIQGDYMIKETYEYVN